MNDTLLGQTQHMYPWPARCSRAARLYDDEEKMKEAAEAEKEAAAAKIAGSAEAAKAATEARLMWCYVYSVSGGIFWFDKHQLIVCTFLFLYYNSNRLLLPLY